MKTKQTNGLYVHIPFCTTICHYCDFPKLVYNEKYIDPFLAQLERDLLIYEVPKDLSTIYVGGGTPTSLSYAELERLLKLLAPFAKSVTEFTFEANVENLTREKVLLLQKYGVNRLSIGVQTTCNEKLKHLNRNHRYEDVLEVIKFLQEINFTNFSVDLIFGLPGQTLNELKQDVAEILKLNAPHLSLYNLTVEENTVAYLNEWPEASEEMSREMYLYIRETLEANGYERYEISNFAKPGYRSKHNELYWQNLHYYAIGYGASGYVNRERYTISGSFTKYLKGTLEVMRENITEEMFIEEYIMLNLRREDGFLLSDFARRTGHEFKTLFAEKSASLIESGLLEITPERVFLTDEGKLLLNFVLFKLL